MYLEVGRFLWVTIKYDLQYANCMFENGQRKQVCVAIRYQKVDGRFLLDNIYIKKMISVNRDQSYQSCLYLFPLIEPQCLSGHYKKANQAFFHYAR